MKTINNSEGQGSFPFRNAYPISDYFTIKSDLDKELKMEEKENKQERGFVYIFENKINSKRKIGHTCNFERRLGEHQRRAKTFSDHFYRAIRKYGWKNFSFLVVEVPKNKMLQIEKYFKLQYKTTDFHFGYDKMIDEEDWSGEKHPFFGKHHSEESKRKKSEAISGEKHPMFGKHPSKETLKKKSEAMSGEKNSMFGTKGEKSPNFGKKHPKHSERMSGEKNPKARPVILISPEGIKHNLPCYQPFCKEHNLVVSGICGVLRGRQKSYKGWTGKYLEDTNDK